MLVGCALGLAMIFTSALAQTPQTNPGSGSTFVECQWTGGFWGERLKICRAASIPSMARIMQGKDLSQFIENFRIASGKSIGKHRGPAWNDGDCYKWLEAVAHLYRAEPDPELASWMDQTIAEIAAAQRADGYLHTPVIIQANAGDPTAIPFADALQFELYNLGHLMTAACVHHRATGQDNLLKVAIKAADFLVSTFSSPAAPLKRSAICPSHYMGLIELSRLTGDASYRQLAKFLIERRDAVVDGTDDNQDRLPLNKQTEVVGHAVRANYLYAGVADLMLDEPDAAMMNVLEVLWRDVHERKIYITGACGALFDGASPDGSSNQKQISRTHQAYGRAFQLPNTTAHNESCASVGNMLWSARMAQLTGQAQYIDSLERSLYNAVLASISLDGTRYFYTNTLRQLDDFPVPLRWSRQREEFIKCFCCPPNVVRTIAGVSQWAYSYDGDRLWVHLYGDNRIAAPSPDGGVFVATQQSRYPWHGNVRITIEKAPTTDFQIALRIPAWADSAALRINGQDQPQPTSMGSYHTVHRVWKVGDVIELELPMRVKLMTANSLVEEARNQVAVQRGPIVYCLESTDLPRGRRVLEAGISANSVFDLQHDDKQLAGATVLETELTFDSSTAQSQALYRELVAGASETLKCRLIPYYAWGNRGPSEMSIWLPLVRK